MKVKKAFDYICSRQMDWARESGIKVDKGYTLSLADNLFQPMLETTRREFQAGKGSELGGDNERGKMQALHSSSALVVNFFEYWRKRGGIDKIARACGAGYPLTEMRFEVTYTNPVGRVPPHLDLELCGTKGCKPLAVESKFTETYSRKTRRELSPVYIKNKEAWEGLAGCEELALRIVEEQAGKSSFQYLDAPQLLKHILGLKNKYGCGGFTLLYLWYEVDSSEAQQHRKEIAEFQSYLKDEIDFRVLTYQELFSGVLEIKGVDEDYIRYLQNRYFKD